MQERESWPTAIQLAPLSDEELRRVDPLVMNLAVAREIPSLADLDIGRYLEVVNGWAAEIRRRMPAAELQFRQAPQNWKNDVRFFRLGLVCWYLDEIVGVEYPDDLTDNTDRVYLDARNVFVHGLIDRRQGTCANMPVLHVAIGWRFGWPVSLACATRHLFCRFDDGEVTHNIEATAIGCGGFRSHPDEYYREHYAVPRVAVACGSDPRAVSAREMLGLFVCIRAMHLAHLGRIPEAESDLLLARHLFPRNRGLYSEQMHASIDLGQELFDRDEESHPANMAQDFCRWMAAADSRQVNTHNTAEVTHGNRFSPLQTETIIARW